MNLVCKDLNHVTEVGKYTSQPPMAEPVNSGNAQMSWMKCKDCASLEECPSGQRVVRADKEFARFCKHGKGR